MARKVKQQFLLLLLLLSLMSVMGLRLPRRSTWKKQPTGTAAIVGARTSLEAPERAACLVVIPK